MSNPPASKVAERLRAGADSIDFIEGNDAEISAAMRLAADLVEAAMAWRANESKSAGTGPITIADMNANYAAHDKYVAVLDRIAATEAQR